MHPTDSPVQWQLPRVTSWWAPIRPADGSPSMEDGLAVEAILSYLAGHAGLGALEAVWVAEPPRRRNLRAPGLGRRTDGAAGSVNFRLGVTSQGVTDLAAARAVTAIEEGIGQIFEAGAHDARPAPAPELPPAVHPVQLLSAPGLVAPSGDDLGDLPGLLARCAIRNGPIVLEARISPMADSEALLREASALHQRVLEQDPRRFVRPDRKTWRRSHELRDLQERFLLELHLRALQPLHPAARIVLARYFSGRLAVPVEIGEAGAPAPRTPVDGAMAGAVLGSCVHAFGKVRRGSAAQEFEACGAPSTRRPRSIPQQDDEELWSSDE